MMWTELRKTLLAGLLVLAPITLTVYILYHLFRLLDGILRDTVIRFLADNLGWEFIRTPIPGLGILALLGVLFIVGAVARNYLGKKLFAIGDYIVTHIPLINRIYTAIVEISEAILSEKREIFKKAVLIEYPRKGLYSVAFFTQDTKGPVQDKLKDDVVSVFLPTTPNPTSGYLLFVPKKDAVDLDMSVEDALKLVISGGSIHLKEQKGFDSFFSLRAVKKRRKRSKRISASGPVKET